MGEFKDGSIWMKVALLMLCLGFFCLGIGFAITNRGGNGGAEACYIIGFLCFLTAVVLILGLVFLDELKDNKPALICLVIFSLIAGIAVIIGVAISHSSKTCYTSGNKTICANTGGQSSYASAYDVMSGLMAILAGIFGILELVGVKP